MHRSDDEHLRRGQIRLIRGDYILLETVGWLDAEWYDVTKNIQLLTISVVEKGAIPTPGLHMEAPWNMGPGK